MSDPKMVILRTWKSLDIYIMMIANLTQKDLDSSDFNILSLVVYPDRYQWTLKQAIETSSYQKSFNINF